MVRFDRKQLPKLVQMVKWMLFVACLLLVGLMRANDAYAMRGEISEGQGASQSQGVAQSQEASQSREEAQSQEPAVTFYIDVTAVPPNNFALLPVMYRVRSDTSVNISQYGFVLEHDPGPIQIVGMDLFNSPFVSFQPFTFTDAGLIEFTASGTDEIFLQGQGKLGDLQLLTGAEGGTTLRFTETDLRSTEEIISDTPVPHSANDSYIFVTNGTAIYSETDTLNTGSGSAAVPVSVTLLNGEDASWSVDIPAGDDWVSVAEDMPFTGSGTFTLLVSGNQAFEPRTTTLQLTANGSTLPPFALVVNQEAGQTATVDLTVNYPAGWNLVSAPFQMENMDENTLFNPITPGTLYSFDGTYQLQSTLQTGTGYWIQFSSAGTGTFSGIPADEITVQVKEGWNLLPALADEAVISDPDGIVMSGTLYGFDGTYYLAGSLLPGQAYWISCSDDGQLMIVKGE